MDDSTARWVQDFNVKPYATPAKLESIDGDGPLLNRRMAVVGFFWLLLLLVFNPPCSCRADLFAGARYQVLLIPDCPGALNDLAHSGSLHRILTHFTSQQSEFHTWRLADIEKEIGTQWF